ncbi:hypothetical protein BJY52DRAFT_1253964 [Lactarius psammicola]|nr:hypothetical protein BJY52DRAFT_1253964 [Lactarius psammicola]
MVVPISLFCLAPTIHGHVHWTAPLIASVPFGTGPYFVLQSCFIYLVIAGFHALFASRIYHTFSTVCATALLAGLATIMAPLPFYRVSAQRSSSCAMQECGGLQQAPKLWA